jgi:hypothetical protein
MNIQPRKLDSRSRRDRCAADGGEACAPGTDVLPGGAALPPSLEIFYLRSFEMAQRVQSGNIALNDAVDMLHSAAAWAGLIDKYGDDEIQALMAKGIIDGSMSEGVQWI